MLQIASVDRKESQIRQLLTGYIIINIINTTVPPERVTRFSLVMVALGNDE